MRMDMRIGRPILWFKFGLKLFTLMARIRSSVRNIEDRIIKVSCNPIA